MIAPLPNQTKEQKMRSYSENKKHATNDEGELLSDLIFIGVVLVVLVSFFAFIAL